MKHRQTYKWTVTYTHRQPHTHTSVQTDGQAYLQRNRWIYRQSDGQTNIQMNWQSYRWTDGTIINGQTNM